MVRLPLRSGSLTRIQARVVAKPGGVLLAPLSGRPCVSYSASVLQRRHDSVQPPPLAFHSAGSDFLLELSGPSQISIAVKNRDIGLFDMSTGLQVKECTFMAAPDAWRGFVLAHLVPSADASTHFGNCVDLGPDSSPLEFRECALLVGSVVTCIGELVRDERGALHAKPWWPRLPAVEKAPSEPPIPGKRGAWCLGRAVPWLASVGSREQPISVPREGLSGRVMVSDHPRFLGNAAWQAQSHWWLDVPEYV
uniref:Uncharacterized protein n=1 Tax=Pyrodinium bahamense TaxID=73915 RepID=A0A7S0B9G6_9DINO